MPHTRVAEATSERGELFLLRRGCDGALELRVNGVFVMDTAHTETERLLASSALHRLAGQPGGVRVFLGGLGLGFTLRETLADARVAAVLVAELEPALLDWHRRGLIPDTVEAFHDERVTVVADGVVRTAYRLPPGSVDVVLLDVDNGPDFLVYESNAVVYGTRFFAECRRKLSPHGLVALWSATDSAELAARIRKVFDAVEQHDIPVMLGTHPTTYHLFLGRPRVGTA